MPESSRQRPASLQITPRSRNREEYAAEDATIAIDETPVGTFVEIEGGEEAILKMTEALGLSTADFILDSYRGLFLQHRERLGLRSSDMIFQQE